ncbi:uncharacterized protein [Phaseolus vulgaris]|uniref:uncharacterized protein n=1 Tax=Phaseolus vulgaris TaxID=3885 RepID=UPI0035CBC4C9
MRRTRQTSPEPSVEEGAVTMAQVLDMMRTLQDNVTASRAEQEKMQAELAASQSRNDELNRVNEELRRMLQTAPSVVSYDLFNVRQYQGESLKDYLNRFGAQVVRLPSKDEDMLVHAFKKGMLLGPFSESLIRSHPSTFAEIRRRAVAHIVAETEVSEKRGSAAPLKPRGGQGKQQQHTMVHEAREGKKVQGKPRPYAPRKDQGRGRARENNAPPRYDFMVGLADLIALPAIAARLRVPEKTDKVLGRKKNEWCEFHQAFGHTLHSCLALGHQLVELVMSGFLADYLRQAPGDRASGSQAGEQQHEIPVHGEVQTIVGGFSGGGCTASQRRRYARSVMAVDSVDEGHFPEVDISFKKADLRDVVLHDNDPVVISLITTGRRVHRVLVDQGSSADVMFWPTFNKLQLSPDQLRPYTGCLYGFAGDQVEVRGYIELRTTFTDGTTARTEKISEEERGLIAGVIERHMGAFAWSASDMPGIDPDFLCHRLSMDPKVRPVRQRRRKFNEEKRKVILDEAKKLLAAGHIREIQYPEWLANVVLVQKPNGKWRMCVDFTDLNKACPKDSYPLSSIDALVDCASGGKLLSFLDAFSGYNQIRMHPRDECKTTFMIERSCYCYKVIPFGLKNAGTTKQRLMDRVLSPMLGRNVHAYVDDMVVTSREKEHHVADLEELFTTIAKYRLKLNLEKCIFGVEAGKFLGFLLTERRIEANPEKCAAIVAMRSPTTVKEVQQLTGRLAALSRFMSAGGEKGHPYFQCLKRNSRFLWTQECEEAFIKLKEYLASPPVLCKPQVGTPLRLYFAVTERAVSSVLVQEQDQLHSSGNDRSAHPKGAKETRRSGKDGQVGGGIVKVRHSVRALRTDKGAGVCRLCGRAVLGRDTFGRVKLLMDLRLRRAMH